MELVFSLILGGLYALIILLIKRYTKPPKTDTCPWLIIKLALLCALGCGLGAVLGGPAAICRAVLLGLALFAVIPTIEKINHVLPGFRVVQAAIIGACAGLTAGGLMASFDPFLAGSGMLCYDATQQTLIIFSGVYGLLVHAAFKASEKRHIAIRFLSVLAAMCLAYILRFHQLVFQTAQPLIILNVIAASVPSCIFIALLWWLPAEKLKILYRSDLVVEDNDFNVKWLNKITICSIIASLLLSLPMFIMVIASDDVQTEIGNSNQTLKQLLTGRIFTKSYIYDCSSNKTTEYQAIASDLNSSWKSFDYYRNIMCISKRKYTGDDKYTDIIFTDATKKQVRINVGFVYVSISPDCRKLAGLSEDGIITIYETASGKLVKQLPGQYNDSLCWSADGKKIFAVSPDKKPSICRIDVASGSVEKLFPGDMPRLVQCDGRIACKDNLSIKFFSPESGKTVTVWNDVPTKFRGYNISPCGKYLIYLKERMNAFDYPNLYLITKSIYEHSQGLVLGSVGKMSWKSSEPVVWQENPPDCAAASNGDAKLIKKGVTQ